MTKDSAKPKSDDWRNLPIADWNTKTFTTYLTHLTKEKFGVTYEPTGGGSKQQRWGREMGMMKQAQTKYGNEVLRKFIEICVERYRANPRYPYMSFSFAYTYMSEQFPVAERIVAQGGERMDLQHCSDSDEVKDVGSAKKADEGIEDWF